VKVELLSPDTAPIAHDAGNARAFGRALDAAAEVFTGAERAEDAYAAGTGSLHDAVYRRAQADVTLGVAAAAVQRTAQALQTLLNLQV
jgi:flagellar hook-basal body complex protein FliE